MATRVVTGTLYHADQVTVWGNAAIVVVPQFVGAYEVSVLTNSSGVFSIIVPLPDSGNGSYVLRLPSDVSVAFSVGAGATAYDVSALILTAESAAPSSQVQALIDAATIVWDTSKGRTGTVTLGGNRTMAAPTNLVAGQTYHLLLTQDGTGSRLVTWNAVFKWAAATAPTLTTGAGKVDLIRCVSDGTNLYCDRVLDIR